MVDICGSGWYLRIVLICSRIAPPSPGEAGLTGVVDGSLMVPHQTTLRQGASCKKQRRLLIGGRHPASSSRQHSCSGSTARDRFHQGEQAVTPTSPSSGACWRGISWQ